MKTYGGVEVQLHAVLTSALDVVTFTDRPLYLRGKSPRYPLDRRLGEPQSRSECRGTEKNLFSPVGNRIPVIQFVAWVSNK
jgi:hypothetical protein